MQETNTICIQCQKPSSTPSNRLVQDACGHRKCRSCLLEDIESCKQCLTTFDPLNEVEHKPIITANNIPSFTDNHTAVIHCNGRVIFNSDAVVKTDNSEIRKEDTIDLKSPADNESGANQVKLEKIKVKEKPISKKNIIQIPPHITVKTDPVSYLCTICNKSFTTKHHVKYHKYCSGELKPHKCEVCNKEFILKMQLQVHMYKHNNTKPFTCTVCQKSFTEKNKLTRHMVLHSSGRNYICSICAKSFKTKESLKVHSSVHKSEKAYTCKICSAKFGYSSNLKKHLASHSSEKAHMCDQCGRRFKLKWSLSIHRRSHSNVRPHACSVCSKAFTNYKDLQRHLLAHTETKAYSCGICLTSFHRKDNLHRHMKNSHPGKKGDIIKNPLKVTELQKKSVVIDNPNAVNVITASPAITKCKADDTVVPVPLQQPTAISTDSRPTGSVINGPIKLAFKTPAFKSNYNITRGGEFVPAAEIAKNLSLTGSVELPLISSPHLASNISKIDADLRQKVLCKPSQCSSGSALESSALTSASPQQSLSTYSSVLHYETSFQNRKHAMIKNIKFKVPQQYTNSFKAASCNNNNNNSNSCKLSVSSELPTETLPMTNKSVIVNNSNLANCSDVHWRRRTSQNLVLKS